MASLLYRWESLPRVAAVWCGPVLELWFWPTDYVWAELRDLVAAEQALCDRYPPVPTADTVGADAVAGGAVRGSVPMMQWSLHRAHGCPVVRVEVATGCPDYLCDLAILVGARPGPAVGDARRQEVWTAAG